MYLFAVVIELNIFPFTFIVVSPRSSILMLKLWDTSWKLSHEALPVSLILLGLAAIIRIIYFILKKGTILVG